MVLLITIITVILLARGGVEALLLKEINSCEQQSHGQEDEDRDLELVREEDGTDDGGDDGKYDEDGSDGVVEADNM